MTRTVIPAILLAAAPAAAQAPPLESLAFMAGCWQSTADARGTVLEETYTTPTTNLILGVSRYVRDGTARSFEFSTIQRSDSAIVLTPHPRGVASVPFRLARVEGEDAIFENPSHDFPQRIRYRKDGESLVARVESLAGEGQEWQMETCRRGDGGT